MKTIFITGASGFVGKHLARFFLSNGNSVIGIGTSSRHPFSSAFDRFTWVSADTSMEGKWQEAVSGSDIISTGGSGWAAASGSSGAFSNGISGYLGTGDIIINIHFRHHGFKIVQHELHNLFIGFAQ